MKSDIKNKDIEALKKALLKKATGYVCEEITNEYTVDENGKEHLQKKKISKKYVPSDLSAIKMLLELFCENEFAYADMSDVELDKEAIKLFKEYQSMTNINLIDELKGEKCGNTSNIN